MVSVPDFFEVVDEVALGVVVGLFADDLDRVLVGADGAIRTEAEEDAAHGFGDARPRRMDHSPGWMWLHRR